jgi:tRNA G37 N-methylase TrmD
LWLFGFGLSIDQFIKDLQFDLNFDLNFAVNDFMLIGAEIGGVTLCDGVIGMFESVAH